MSAIVIDTNVLLVADGKAKQMELEGDCKLKCQLECENRLVKVMENEQVVLDYGYNILGEYHNRLNPNNRSPSPGSAFLKWLLQRQGNVNHVTFVTITPLDREETKFQEFPPDAALEKRFDPADRKFVAVANVHKDKPPILEAADSKWLGWEEDLAAHGIKIEVLCRSELVEIRRRKTTDSK